MSNDKEIEILMKDGCTKDEAKKHLKNGSIVYEDFEQNFDGYMEELGIDDEDIPEFKKMITDKVAPRGWGIVEDDGHTYYISYWL